MRISALATAAVVAVGWVTIPGVAGAAPPVDRTAPSIVSVAPTNNAVNVPVGVVPAVRYNEALNVAGSTYTLKTASSGKSVTVPASLVYDASTFTVRVFPTTQLNYSYVYTMTLKVKDVAGNQSSNLNLTFTTQSVPPPPNQAPVAKLTVNPTTGVVPVDVTADASTSTDDKAVTGYSIDFGDGTVTTTATAQHTYVSAGEYTVKATVTDAGGLSSSASTTVTVSSKSDPPPPPVDNPPSAALIVSPTTGYVPLNTALNAGSSSDDKGIVSYAFDYGDGTPVDVLTGSSASHSYGTAGTYTATVTVTDTAEQTSTASAVITVNPSRFRPINNDCSAGYVTFTFDDGPDSNTPAMLETLRGLNIKGVFFVEGQKLDNKPAGQQILRDTVADGHVIGNHTYDHKSITGQSTGTGHLTDAQIVDEMERTSNLIVAAGAPKPTLYRPPFGDIDAYSDNMIRELGYRVVSPWAYQYNADGVIVDTKDWEGASTAEIVQRATVGYTNAAGRFYPGMADKAIILTHDGQQQSTLNSIAAMQPIVDYMNTNHFCATTEVRSDATGGHVPPPAPSYPTSGNMVVNPSLETAWAPGNSAGVGVNIPDCFEPNNNSKATAVWGPVSDAHTGVVAEKVTITKWSGNDNKLVMIQRGGGTGTSNRCMPIASPGTQYRLWVHYKGTWPGYGATTDTTKVGIATFYRIPAVNAACPTGGTSSPSGWCYWQSSPVLPPSQSWYLASFKTAALPAGADAVSFGLAIAGNGTVTTDDYAMVAQ